MQASKIIDAVQEVANDTDGVTYTSAQVIEWINDAIRMLLSKRPDALVELRAIQLAAGTKQTLPSDAHKLLGLIRNMGTDGSTPGKAIRGPVSQEELDAFNPDWHNDTAATEITEYIYNITDPLQFYVIPPVTSAQNVYVEARIAVNHTAIANTTDVIPVVEPYAPALTEWVLYGLFSRDNEKTPNYVRASRHYQQFFTILGEKMTIDGAVPPQVAENL